MVRTVTPNFSASCSAVTPVRLPRRYSARAKRRDFLRRADGERYPRPEVLHPLGMAAQPPSVPRASASGEPTTRGESTTFHAHRSLTVAALTSAAPTCQGSASQAAHGAGPPPPPPLQPLR